MPLPLVSIVTTTKNEEKHMDNHYKAIRAQTYPQKGMEAILVDNYSSDRTKEIARQYTDKVYDKGPERSAQRNYGMRDLAGGKYVMYLDADMSMSQGVVKACVERMEEDPSLQALYISEIVMGEKFWSKVRRFERSFYDATVIDCVRFIRKETFGKVGGFDESMTGPEDWDLDKKIRQAGKVGLVKEPIHHNEAEFDLGKYLKKKQYYSRSFDTYIKKWGQDDPDVKKQLGVSYRFFWAFVEDGKWRKLVSHPILAAATFFLKFMTGLMFLTRRKGNFQSKVQEKGEV